MKERVKVVIIHGSYGNPEENWFPWIANEVRKIGHEVITPKLPTPEGQNLDTWRKKFTEQVGNLTSNMVLVWCP
jgi:predicted alpha/beta hydrolase family esterase